MAKRVREFASAIQRCVNKIAKKPEEALRVADQVERQKERVDDLYENARQLLAEETTVDVGVEILTSHLFNAIEMVLTAARTFAIR